MPDSFATSWTAARQGPLSMGFSRQEYCSGLPFPSPGDLPDPGIEPAPLMSPALTDGSLPRVPQGSPQFTYKCNLFLYVVVYLASLLNSFLTFYSPSMGLGGNLKDFSTMCKER